MLLDFLILAILYLITISFVAIIVHISIYFIRNLTDIREITVLLPVLFLILYILLYIKNN